MIIKTIYLLFALIKINYFFLSSTQYVPSRSKIKDLEDALYILYKNKNKFKPDEFERNREQIIEEFELHSAQKNSKRCVVQ